MFYLQWYWINDLYLAILEDIYFIYYVYWRYVNYIYNIEQLYLNRSCFIKSWAICNFALGIYLQERKRLQSKHEGIIENRARDDKKKKKKYE